MFGLVWKDVDALLIILDRFDHVWICWEVWKCSKTLDRFGKVWKTSDKFGKV